MKESNSYDKLGLTVRLNAPYEEAVEKAREALKAEGFGVLTEIDVKDTLKKKIDADFHRYVILGACNPNLAHKALQADPAVGLLLPCNVVVEERDGGSIVSALNPALMAESVPSEAIREVARDATERLQRAMTALAG
jgi:uncharacterized protein (DUF302 family)